MFQEIGEDKLLKVCEVAEKLRLSKSAVYNLIARKLIPHVDLSCGDRLVPRIRLSDLHAFIRSRLSEEGECNEHA